MDITAIARMRKFRAMNKLKKVALKLKASIQPGGTVTFEHRNIKGQNRSIVGSVTSSNLLNPQDDLSFKLEYVHPYLDGVYNGARQLPTGALSMDGPLTTLSSTGVDRMAFAQANITCDNTKFVNSAIVGERNVFQLDQGLGIGTNFPFFNHRQLTLTRFTLGGPNSVRGYNMGELSACRNILEILCMYMFSISL
ncbi:protein TOC75-3, chloroplastic-like [Asparagus officinalis]|uniref:protein TOC75-3, chloroplastic-like n=1 Tax=Asparagus officinalis TaxID=4686 RepID=UPI00098E415B|nr:protein TOC75-3, chloroplastic-like [Asparagus officinalis]XP_020268039.1 protein TOC75-3, chloroplastic-like [Asparagus officinalis]